VNLHPDNDGFLIANGVARLAYGDSFWTWKKLSKGLIISLQSFAILFLADKTTDLILTKA
jgi:hypothetical protein